VYHVTCHMTSGKHVRSIRPPIIPAVFLFCFGASAPASWSSVKSNEAHPSHSTCGPAGRLFFVHLRPNIYAVTVGTRLSSFKGSERQDNVNYQSLVRCDARSNCTCIVTSKNVTCAFANWILIKFDFHTRCGPIKTIIHYSPLFY
jgi:hypothetical protein